jgi:RimJ/RimL family protein N-acetyltransferase
MIPGKGVRLRALEREDLTMVVSWFNDPDTRATLASWRPMSMADEARWFDAISGSKTDMVFVIEAVSGAEGGPRPRAVGSCGIHHIDWKNRTCVVGILIGDKSDRGKGLGTEAMRALVRWAHKELGLHRVELEVFPHNAAGVKSYERLGFTRDGVRRGAYFRDGKFHDLYLMSALPGELLELP